MITSDLARSCSSLRISDYLNRIWPKFYAVNRDDLILNWILQLFLTIPQSWQYFWFGGIYALKEFGIFQYESISGRRVLVGALWSIPHYFIVISRPYWRGFCDNSPTLKGCVFGIFLKVTEPKRLLLFGVAPNSEDFFGKELFILLPQAFFTWYKAIHEILSPI